MNEHGAQYVLNSSDKDFDQQLGKLNAEVKANVALECVSDDMPGRILNQMPHKSTLISYGSLSMKPMGAINPASFIYKQ